MSNISSKNTEVLGGQVRPLSGTTLVVGAGGGIGAALLDRLAQGADTEQIVALHTQAVSSFDPRVMWLQLDLGNPRSVTHCANELAGRISTIDTLICASGYLHGAHGGPEKSLGELLDADLSRTLVINATGPLQLLAACMPLLKRAVAPRVCFLSAQVGSIGDNRLGGWYSYRMSKAALNMGVKTAAIELERWRNEPTIVAVHPGTTQSELSRPFTKRRPVIPATAGECAERLIGLLERLKVQDSGRFLNHDGTDLPW